MSINLTILFGAGASVDVIPQKNSEIREFAFRPRGVKTLFHNNQELETIAREYYDDVYTVFPQIIKDVSKGVSIEDWLKKLKYTKQVHKKNNLDNFLFFFNTISLWPLINIVENQEIMSLYWNILSTVILIRWHT